MVRDALAELADAETLAWARTAVAAVVPPTPQYAWPLLDSALGHPVVVKHENHTPIGAFKIRGGVWFMTRLRQAQPCVQGVISATRGNHGQSLALAARRAGLRAVVVVPHGNSREKNAAMAAFGAELIEHGHDFQAAFEHAMALAATEGLLPVRPFHPWLVQGVASAGLELLEAEPELDVVYVPVGQGSGLCAMLAARRVLGHRTRVKGVVAEGAPCYALSFRAGAVQSTEAVTTEADGLACRVPDETALDVILDGAADVVTVSDAAIRAAQRLLFRATHNVAEPAGAAALAAALAERDANRGRRVGVVLSGGNVDTDRFAAVLAEEDPS